MIKRICFDEKIEKILDARVNEIKSLGIKNPSRTRALRTIIEEWNINRRKILRKPKSKEFTFR